MKILNLYSCLGGNRYKWDEVAQEAGIEIEVTAVEWDEELARLYQERFPNDIVIVADAHQFLLDHYKEFDFIWSSPPCPSHSRARYWSSKGGKYAVEYPDLMLYQEILFLQHFSLPETKWVVENVIPYYQPLITPQERGRHLYWTNFILPNFECRKIKICQGVGEVNNLSEFHDYDFRKYKGGQRLNKIARNLVDYEAGRTIFETALGMIRKSNTKQTSIFDEL
jgi:DNA (cytosine-5)-methyltransferase 1